MEVDPPASATHAAALQQRERENANIKMEVAPLRERLHQRTGGDATTTDALRNENVRLHGALWDAQQQLAALRAAADAQQQLAAADARHAEMLRNLVCLDDARKAGVDGLARCHARAATLTLRQDADAREMRLLRQAASGAEQLRGQLTRAQSESAECRARQALAEADAARLAQQVAELQQIAHTSQVHRAEYEYLLRDAQQDAAAAHYHAREMKKLQREVDRLLAEGDGSDGAVAAAAAGDIVRMRVRMHSEVHWAKHMAIEADKVAMHLRATPSADRLDRLRTPAADATKTPASVRAAAEQALKAILARARAEPPRAKRRLEDGGEEQQTRSARGRVRESAAHDTA